MMISIEIINYKGQIVRNERSALFQQKERRLGKINVNMGIPAFNLSLELKY
jgi:hypothetical protein